MQFKKFFIYGYNAKYLLAKRKLSHRFTSISHVVTMLSL